MSAHLQREIERLKKHVLSLCALVEDQVQMALRAVLDRDDALADEVERRDLDIDQREIEVEEECMKTLALPSAGGRRFAADHRHDEDQQRSGADRRHGGEHRPQGRALVGEPPRRSVLRPGGDVGEDAGHAPRQHRRPGQHGRGAGQRGLPPRRRGGPHEASSIRIEIEERIAPAARAASGPTFVCLAVSRNLERIADLATNIAEDVVYLVEGRIVRHAFKASRRRRLWLTDSKATVRTPSPAGPDRDHPTLSH